MKVKCPKCGTENACGSKYCKRCGKPIRADICMQEKEKYASEQVAGKQGKETLMRYMSSLKALMPKFTGIKKHISKKKIAGVSAVIVIAAVVGAVFVNTGKTIQLDDYLVIETEGYEGYGKATAFIDWAAIKSKYGSKLSFTKAAKEEFGRSLRDMNLLEFLKDEIKVSLDESTDLSNGDNIAYTWELEDDLPKYVGCKFKYKNGDYQVSDLEEVGTFDAFADVTIEFSGTEPHGKAGLNYTGLELYSADFNCSKTNDLKNGDVITVQIKENSIENCAKTKGIVPKETKKEYIVTGLEHVLSKIEELDDETLQKMIQQGFDEYNAQVARDWTDEGEKLEKITYIGNYLLTPKNKDSQENLLYLIYKAQIHNSNTEDGRNYDQINDIYWYIQYSNLLVDGESKVKAEVTKYNALRYGHKTTFETGEEWWEKRWTYDGYATLDDLYKDVVIANIDSYNHEDNITENGTSAEPTMKNETAASDKGEYILPLSNTKVLTREDIETLSAEERKIALNEIYARHGRKFKDAKLQAHFDACSWYTGTIEPENFKEAGLSEIEIANRDLLVQYREEMGE